MRRKKINIPVNEVNGKEKMDKVNEKEKGKISK